MPITGYKSDISQFLVTQLLLNFLSNAKKMSLCKFHENLGQNPAENWFLCKQQVSREIHNVKAALRQLNFVCKLHESIYYFQNLSISCLRAY